MESLLPQRRVSSTPEELRRRFVPPDGGYGWFIVFGSFFSYFWITGLIKSFGVLLLEIFVVFEGSSIVLGAWIPSILATFTLCLSPVTGALVERFSERIVVFAGSLLCCSGLIMSCFVTRIEHLIVTIGVISGLGAGLALLPGVLITSKYFKNRRALANGLCVSGTAGGSIVLPRLIQILVHEFGLRGTFLLLAGGVLQVCVCAALMRPIEVHQLITEIDEKRKKQEGESKIKNGSDLEKCDDKEEKKNNKEEVIACDILTVIPDDGIAENYNDEKVKDVKTKPQKKSFLKAFDFSLLKNTTFLLCTFTVGLMALTNPHFVYYMPSYVTKELGVSKSDAAILVSISAGVDMVGRIGGGWLADRRWIPLGKMYVMCFIVACIAPLGLPFASGMPVLAVLSACFGIATGCWFLLVPTILTEYHGVDKISYSYGLARLFQGISTFCSPLMIGSLLRSTESYSAVFFMMAAALFLGAFLMLFFESWTRRYEENRSKDAKKITIELEKKPDDSKKKETNEEN